MFVKLAARLWADECGAVIATEYLMLGTIVAAGGVTGLTAMRDAMVSEYQEFGNSVREVRKAYTPPQLTRKPGGQHAPAYAPLTTDGFAVGNDPVPPPVNYNAQIATVTP